MSAMTFQRDTTLSFPSCLDGWLEKTSRKVAQVDRKKTAAESVSFFYHSVSTISSDNESDFACVMMMSVGLRAASRSSLFDLYWVLSTDKMYAVDSKDYTFVCVAT